MLESIVLDEGFVRLVNHMGDDLSIVRAARVSFDAEWRTGQNKGSDRRLIEYLMNNDHNTPFEAVEFQFEIKAPIFVLRQWMRHRTWSFNEVSARYTELPDEFYIPTPASLGKQSKSNKQGRDMESYRDSEEAFSILCKMSDHNQSAFRLYRELLSQDIPREIARTVLPLATYSRMFAKVDLHNLFKFLGERLHPHSQYEIRVYAEIILGMIKTIVPNAVQAWENKNENNT